MSRHRWDLVCVAALVASAITLFMMVVYLWIMRREADAPAAWFVAGLILGVLAAGYGAAPGSAYRGSALILAGMILVVVGALAILSIGMPILLAGALCLFAGARTSRASPGARST